jgi:hypothetical protein
MPHAFKMNSQFHVQVILPSAKNSFSTHLIEDLVGPKAGLDAQEKNLSLLQRINP